MDKIDPIDEWELPPNIPLQNLLAAEEVQDAIKRLEQEAVETALTRQFDDDMGRLRALTQVHGLRDLMGQLRLLAAGKKKAKPRRRT